MVLETWKGNGWCQKDRIVVERGIKRLREEEWTYTMSIVARRPSRWLCPMRGPRGHKTHQGHKNVLVRGAPASLRSSAVVPLCRSRLTVGEAVYRTWLTNSNQMMQRQNSSGLVMRLNCQKSEGSQGAGKIGVESLQVIEMAKRLQGPWGK